MANTKISWCDKVWNPVTGCTKVSEGCRHCYAEIMAKRLQAMGQPHYANGFRVTCHEDALDAPLHWRKPARIFVNSMSDLFHKDVSFVFIDAVFDRMMIANHHTYQILTKRPDRAIKYLAWRKSWASNALIFGKHIWLGISVENQKAADERIPLLLQIPSAMRFLSCEPLLGPIEGLVSSLMIGWVIVGGESGPNYRPMEPDWALSIRDQCQNAGVPFFFKQTGGLHHGSDLLDGTAYKEFPR